MNIVYVAPRYHTNQIPIMKGWKDNGDSVHFISQYKGKTEDYSILTPIILGYSKVFRVINTIYKTASKKNKKSANVEYFQVHYGFPSRGKIKKVLGQLTPELIILRDRSIYNMVVYRVAQKKRISCILYNQTPFWETEGRKKDFLHRIIRKNSPKYRITPVLGEEQKGRVEDNTFFVPFVMNPSIAPENKEISDSECIRILCIGKYEDRKNQIMLLKVFQRLQKEFSIKLTFVGEVSTLHHKEYYEKLQTYIKENALEDGVTTNVNLSREQVYEEYRRADLFVIPSTKEFASISQLEAMACSLPVICSNKNGTASYVEEGTNGYWFDDNNEESLAQSMRKILSDSDNLREMGKNSYRLVCEKYNFDDYCRKILEIKSEMELIR